MDEYEWGDASVSFPDWIGTAQLDQKMTGTVGVYELTGIDRDEWLIVGLEFAGGESGMHNPHVIAVRQSEWGERHISDVSDVRAADIEIHGVDAFELLRQMTHMLNMRFRIRATKNATITITELLDEPPRIRLGTPDQQRTPPSTSDGGVLLSVVLRPATAHRANRPRRPRTFHQIVTPNCRRTF